MRRYSREIAGFLRDQGVKSIVIACNTATAHALTRAARRDGHAGDRRRRAGRARGGRGDDAWTHRRHRHRRDDQVRRIRASDSRARAPTCSITPRACPLFVPLVEEGWTDHEATRLVAREYLEPMLEAEIDTLVLGCTHYPLLKPLLRDVLGPDRSFDRQRRRDGRRDGAYTVGARNSLRDANAEPVYRFIASDDPLQFLQLGQRFLGGTMEGVEIRTLG